MLATLSRPSADSLRELLNREILNSKYVFFFVVSELLDNGSMKRPSSLSFALGGNCIQAEIIPPHLPQILRYPRVSETVNLLQPPPPGQIVLKSSGLSPHVNLVLMPTRHHQLVPCVACVRLVGNTEV